MPTELDTNTEESIQPVDYNPPSPLSNQTVLPTDTEKDPHWFQKMFAHKYTKINENSSSNKESENNGISGISGTDMFGAMKKDIDEQKIIQEKLRKLKNQPNGKKRRAKILADFNQKRQERIKKMEKPLPVIQKISKD